MVIFQVWANTDSEARRQATEILRDRVSGYMISVGESQPVDKALRTDLENLAQCWDSSRKFHRVECARELREVLGGGK